MFDILSNTSSLSESDPEDGGSRCGKLSEVSLKRLRKIVQRQQLSCSEDSFSIKGIENGSSSEGDENEQIESLLSGTEERPTTRIAHKMHHPIRKVTEGTAPSAYLGFSVLHQSQSDSTRHALGVLGTENTAKLVKRSPDRRVARQHIRSLDPKPNASRPLKRFVATGSKPAETNGFKNGASSVERKPVRKPATTRKSSQSRERKIAGQKLQSAIGSEQNNLANGDLPAIATADRKPGELSVLEQVKQLIGANAFGVNKEAPAMTETSGNSVTVPSKKGIYRAEWRKKRPVHEPAPPAENVCKRQRGVSRADLQALVRKQREARKAERLNRERAERERRERIQRNLSAIAQAAALAAKAPLPSPRRPLVLTDRNTAREIDDGYRSPTELLLAPESNRDIDFASERHRKLDELLKNDDEQAITWSPRILNGLSVNPKSARSVGSESNWTAGTVSSVNHLAPSRQPSQKTAGQPWTRESIPREPVSSENVVRDWRTRSPLPTSNCTVDYASYPQPGGCHRRATAHSKQLQVNSKSPATDHQSRYEPLWIPLSCHLPESGSGALPEQHNVLVLHPVETHHEDEDRVSSLSSLEQVSPSDAARWMRLEAVGASEPETSTADEPGGQFVDDLKSSDFDPIQLERRVDALLRLSRAPLVNDPDGCTELAALKEIHNSDYLDLKRFIYSDPLRLSALMKRGTQADPSGPMIRSSTAVRETKAKPARSQIIPSSAHAVPKQPCSDQSTRAAPVSPRTSGTARLSHSPHHEGAHDRSPRSAVHSARSPRSARSAIDPSVITAATDITKSPNQWVQSNSSSEQQDFITRAASDAISSTPRRETVRATSLLHEAARQTASSVVHGSSLPPRLTAAALSLRLSEEVNHLEALACSIQHVTDMESLRQFAGAQTETVALAQLLKNQQTRTQEEEEDKHSDSPKVKTPRKQSASVRSQATSITPDTLHLHHGLHSPQFAEVIRAAEEFHKVERRLSKKAAQIETPRTGKRSPNSTEAGAVTRQTKPISEVSNSPVSRASSSQSASSVIQLASRSSSKTSPRQIQLASDTVSEVSTEPPPDSSSVPDSARSLPTDGTLSVADDLISANHASGFQEKLSSEARSVSTESRGTHTPVDTVRSEISSVSTAVVQPRSTGSSTSTARSPSQPSLLSGDAVKSSPAQHQTKPRSPPITFHPQHTQNSTSLKRSSVTPVNRTDDGSEDVLSLTQIDSGLLKRAAILKMRRERAEKLLALSRNLEKEEAEVVRLEMEALKAYQTKRKKARTEMTRYHMPGPSTTTATAVDRSTSFSPKHSKRSSDHSGTSPTTPTASRRSRGHDLDHRSHTATLHAATVSGESVPSVPELSDLSRSDLISKAQTVTASIRSRDHTIRSSILQSGPRVSSIVQTISTATGQSSPRNTAGRSRTEADGRHDGSGGSDENLYTSLSFGRSKRSGDQLDRSESREPRAKPAGKSDAGHSTPQLRKQLITTADLLSSSSDRATPPTPKQPQAGQPPQHPTTASRSEFSCSGRRRRISSSNLSGPTSADSMDEDHGTEAPPGEDYSISAVSASNSSQIDLSAMESRIRALHVNLQRQEAILARINQRHKYMSTDRLVRFESTVLQHKQLCTDIIESIKRQLKECQPAALLDSLSRHSLPPSPATEPGSHNRSIVSHGAAASVISAAPKLSASRRSAARASPFEEPQEEQETSQIRTLVSLAEDLVSATDTEGDLQKLGFDDKIESAASSPTLGERTATPSAMNSPDSRPGEHTLRSNDQSPRIGDEMTSADDSLKSISDAVGSVSHSGRTTRASAHEDNEVQTPVRLELSAVDDDEQLSSARFSSPRTRTGVDHSTLKYAQEHGLSPPPSGDYVASSEPMSPHAPVRLSVSMETDYVHTTTIDEPHPGSIAITTNGSARNDAVLRSLPRSTSVKLGAVSDLPTSVDADAAHSNQVPPTDMADSSRLSTVDVLQPVARSQSILQSATADSIPSTTETRKPALIDNLTTELFKKLVSDAINDAMRAQESKAKLTERTDVDEMDSPELSQSMVCLRDIPEEPVEDEVKSEVTEPTADSESLSDTGDASLNLPVPSMFSVENIRGLVADVPARTEPLIRMAFDYLWQKRLEAPNGAREPALTAAASSPPNKFQFDLLEDEDLTPDLYSLSNLRFVSRRLLFDLVCEVMQQIYAGEDEEFVRIQTGLPAHGCVTSSQFRLWQGQTRPSDKEHLYSIVQTQVRQILGLRNNDQRVSQSSAPSADCSNLRDVPGKLSTGTRFSRLAQWTLSKKPYLDRLLELELRADEGSWLSYVPEEQRLKRNLSQQIWDELVRDAIDSMLRIMRSSGQRDTTSPIVSKVEVST